MLRKIKVYLDQDINCAKRNIELASEESDVRSRASSIDVRSPASSMDPQVSKPVLRFLKQTVEEDIINDHECDTVKSISQSSADEADDEQNIQVSTLH